MTRSLIAVVAFVAFTGVALAQSSQVCKAWNYISNGKPVYCNTCCYGGNCSTSCKQT
jgi:hypothetical protein